MIDSDGKPATEVQPMKVERQTLLPGQSDSKTADIMPTELQPQNSWAAALDLFPKNAGIL